MPAWRANQPVNQWREITGTRIAALAATNEAKTTVGGQATGAGISYGNRVGAWCGLSIDTRSSTIYSAANGGHGDYFGNEVVAVGLGSNVPAWTERRAGSSGNVVNTYADIPSPGDRKFAHYADGLPASRHSYSGQQFIERHNRALTLGGSISTLGSFYENVESFNTATNQWDVYNPGTQAPPYGYAVGGNNSGWTPAAGWSVCKDPRDESIYTVASITLHRFTPSSSSTGGTWTNLGSTHPELNPGTYAGMVIDTVRNRLVWMLGSGGDGFRPYTYNLSTRQWSKHSFPDGVAKDAMVGTRALSEPGYPKPHSPGMVYVPEMDRIYVRMAAGGGLVYVVDPSSFAVSVLETTGGVGIPDAAPFGDQQGVFNRWLYAPALRGMAFVPNGGGNVWFLRLF